MPEPNLNAEPLTKQLTCTLIDAILLKLDTAPPHSPQHHVMLVELHKLSELYSALVHARLTISTAEPRH
jgi:hypothetical protein